MKIVGFIEEAATIENPDVKSGLRLCNLWKVAEPCRGKEPAPHPPPAKTLGPPVKESGPALDYRFFEQHCV
jgi:hypothetical protein